MLFFLCLGRDPYDIPVAVFNGELEPKLSSDFLQTIDNHTIRQILYNSFDDGFESVKSGKTRALIAIGANFTKAMIDRGMSGYDADKQTIDMSAIKLYLDMTSESNITLTLELHKWLNILFLGQFAANKIMQTIHESYQLFAKQILRDNEMDEAIADPPIQVSLHN